MRGQAEKGWTKAVGGRYLLRMRCSCKENQSHLGKLLIKEDGVYVTREVGDMELEWLLDRV